MKGSDVFEPGVSRLAPGSSFTPASPPGKLVSAARQLQRHAFASVERMSMLFFVVYFLFCLLFVNKFANPVNLTNMLVQCADLIILACGMTFVFMNGGIDFSVTATLALGSIFGAKVMTMPGSPLALSVLGVLVMLGIGIGIGALNGLTVTRLRMPSFIATMATQLIFAGLALWYTQSATIGGLPKPFLLIGRGAVFGIQMPVFIMFAVVAITAFVLHRTVLGRYIFSVGTNHRTSLISGIPVKKTIFTLFLFSGGLAAISGIIMTSRSGAGMPALGKGMLMDIVGAVVIGGTAVTGGSGSILGTAVGAALIIVLNNSLNLLGIEWYVINALKGVMITLVALLGVLRTANGR
jgi:ribose/xylose/arabinose/galactoside ABC-type transport system permease subunit